MIDLDDFEITPDAEEVPLCLRGDLVARIDQLERDLKEALVDDERENRRPQAPALAEQVEELRREADGFTKVFRIQSIPRSDWKKLRREHPPEDDHVRMGLDFNPETFPVAAFAACLVSIDGDPVAPMDYPKAERFLDSITEGQFMRLWTAVNNVNVRSGGALPKSDLVTGILRYSEPTSTTPSPEESR